jgi:hypothetical protein
MPKSSTELGPPNGRCGIPSFLVSAKTFEKGYRDSVVGWFIDENKLRQTHGAVVLGGKKIADFQTVQKRVGEAAARIDACRLLAQHAIDAAELEVRHDGKSSLAIRLLSRRTQSFIANEAKTAIDLIFDAAGGRCLQHGHPLQRAWRDVAAINHHISLNFDAVMSMYGQFPGFLA